MEDGNTRHMEVGISEYITLFRRFSDQAPVPQALLEPHGGVIATNPAFRQGIEGGSGITSLREVVHTEDWADVFEALKQIESGALLDRHSVCRYRGVQGVSWWRIALFKAMDGVIAGYFEEIGDTIREHQSLLKAKHLAEQSAQAKSLFLANVSHEIRTPIHTLLGMAELLAETALDAEQEEYLQQIHFSADALLGLINDILDFSKIEAGKLTIEEIEFDFHTAIETVMDMLSLEAYKKGLELIIDIDPAMPLFVVSDPTRFRQVLINLVNNAIKFTNTGYVKATVRVFELDEPLPGAVYGAVRFEVRISDTGIGVDPEKRSQLFQSFSQLDATTTRRFGGTGLGLAITKNLVELMGGRIGVDSTPGQGSEFWVTMDLPCIPSMLPQERFNALTSRRVLILDDCPECRRVIGKMLASEHITLYDAENSRDAVNLLRRQREQGAPVDIVLVDLVLSGMDGWQFASLIHGDPELGETRLFLMSPPGSMGGEAKMKLLRWFDGYISKPIKQRDTLAILSGALERGIFLDEGQNSDVNGMDTEEPLELEELEEDRSLLEKDTSPARHSVFMSVLLAEDHPVNQRLFQTIIERLGHRVRTASNGQEAVDLASREDFDVIFMDVHMPVMDGYAAAAEIRRFSTSVPIIAVTANALQGEWENCRKAGMTGYLAKPFSKDQVEEVLREIFEPDSQEPAPGFSYTENPQDPPGPPDSLELKDPGNTPKSDSQYQENSGSGLLARITTQKRSTEPGAHRDGRSTPGPREALQPQLRNQGEELRHTGDRDHATQVFDYKKALATFMNRPEILHEVLQHFLAATPQQIYDLGQCITQGDLKCGKNMSHSIKGSAWNLAAMGLGNAASRLEAACADGNTAQAPWIFEQLRQEWQHFEAAVQEAVPGASAT
ncbi:hybrid sensor histidine kinase/response regulator [Spirochaeta lutea]|uniref:hybrid sensor histidine kinase/response regulator n=1 Tax=Spirochaeta lutea TaxID=1480694 RepID=UPI00138E27A4|nr:hybrid sensor histidine kinase/response regulator [Spirochaeta lutea]